MKKKNKLIYVLLTGMFVLGMSGGANAVVLDFDVNEGPVQCQYDNKLIHSFKQKGFPRGED